MNTQDEIPMAELRLDVPVDDLAVLDAFVQADSARSRASVVRDLIRQFSDAQVHVATMVCRARRINPLSQEQRRSDCGT